MGKQDDKTQGKNRWFEYRRVFQGQMPPSVSRFLSANFCGGAKELISFAIQTGHFQEPFISYGVHSMVIYRPRSGDRIFIIFLFPSKPFDAQLCPGRVSYSVKPALTRAIEIRSSAIESLLDSFRP